MLIENNRTPHFMREKKPIILMGTSDESNDPGTKKLTKRTKSDARHEGGPAARAKTSNPQTARDVAALLQRFDEAVKRRKAAPIPLYERVSDETVAELRKRLSELTLTEFGSPTYIEHSWWISASSSYFAVCENLSEFYQEFLGRNNNELIELWDRAEACGTELSLAAFDERIAFLKQVSASSTGSRP